MEPMYPDLFRQDMEMLRRYRVWLIILVVVFILLYPIGSPHYTVANSIWEETVKPALPDEIERHRKELSRGMRRFLQGFGRR